MRLLSIVTLALLWLTVTAQAAGHNGCCTAFSKVRVVRSIIKTGGNVWCRRQDITEGCNIYAVVLMWKHHRICVNPIARKMRKVLKTLCTRKKRKGGRNPRHLHRRNTRNTYRKLFHSHQ